MIKNNQKQNLLLIKDLGMMYPTTTSNRKTRHGLYECPLCKKEFIAITDKVKKQLRKSCGCSVNAHKQSNHRLYKTWQGMMTRCYNEKVKSYKDYGGRGIFVCESWHDVKNFIDDMYPTFKEGLTLDRENNDLGYSKDNCRWAKKTIQQRNTRIRKDNTSGYRGVSYNKFNKKWDSYININSKKIHIGHFADKLDAAKAYDGYVLNNNLEHTKNF